MKSLFEDDFDNYNTTTILGSKQPTDLEKARIFKVIEYISKTSMPNIAVEHSKEFHNLVVEISKIKSDESKESYVKKYDLLKSKIEGCKTNECLLLHVAKVYGLTPKSLLMETIAIHSRIKALKNKDTWFDNFSLNSFLLQLTTIVYSNYDDNSDKFIKSVDFDTSKYDSSSILSGGGLNDKIKNKNIDYTSTKNKLENKLINKDKSKLEDKTLIDKYINLKQNFEINDNFNNLSNEFIINRNIMYDYETAKINLPKNNIKSTKTNLSGGDDNIKSQLQSQPITELKTTKKENIPLINKSISLTNPKDLLFHLGNNYRTFFEFGKLATDITDNDTATKMLDSLVKKYPYFTGCTHGCDVFTPDFKDKSVSIGDISEFCKRYPLSIVGYILNTKTYKSGKGQHWMALLFKYKTCYLICSQKSDFSAFEEKTLEEDLGKYGFSKVWNLEEIQHDPSSCGLYSVLANLCFIIKGSGDNKPDIVKIVDMIGNKGENINKDGIYVIKKKLAGW